MRIWNSNVDFDILLEIKPKYFATFPGSRWGADQGYAFKNQEPVLRGMKVVKGVRFSSVYQKDGSRMKVMRCLKIASAQELLQKLEEAMPNKGKIVAERYLGAWGARPEAVRRVVNAVVKGEVNGDWLYRAYRTNDFLNGSRYFPVIIFPEKELVINISPLFASEMTPEDDMGLLVENNELVSVEERLSIDGHEPEEWPFLAGIRLCRCCGVVSDFSKPKTGNPWVSLRKERG